ncbi:hypothetical protein V7x_43670 [Crateriforma conspicua]|uniref:Uncharacterized protein n=1 Tax=Crateriforma conspicua TaxID=2527996 RepID=A0A5C6FN69_9PLAN|nr:hypothetical protein V7x_43670 [Crateriforma conspicua]
MNLWHEFLPTLLHRYRERFVHLYICLVDDTVEITRVAWPADRRFQHG